MKSLKKGFNDDEILEFHLQSNTKEIKQKKPILLQT